MADTATTDLHLPVAFDNELQARDRRYWEQATKMVIRPQAQGQEGVRALVESLAPDYGVSPQLATAVAETESNFNPWALSKAGAQGVMQLMPETAARYNVGDVWNPEANIRGGLQEMARLQQRFPGRVDLQLAAYNAGEGAVVKHGNAIPPYPETQEYVAKIQARLAGTPYVSKQAGTGAPGAVPGEAATPEAPPEWTPARRPIEPPLEEPLGARLGPRLATGVLGSVEAGLKGVEPLERSMGLSTGIGALATATAQDLEEYVTSKLRPTGTERTPLDTTAEALGQALPFFIPGMATEAMVGRLAMVAPKVATAIGFTTSGVLQGVTAAGGTYDALKGVVGEEEAAKRASHAFATNTLLGTVGSALGVFNRVVPSGLSRAVVGAVSQGVQGAVQYDVQRGEFWVPAEHPSAQTLLEQGWEAHAGRVVQPYKFKDQLEAALVQGVVGGVIGGMQELSKLPLPAKLQAHANEPGFTAQRAVEAALAPDLPPGDVPLATWQRWGAALLDLLPEVGHGKSGVARSILGSERGSTGGQRGPSLEAGATGLSPDNYRTEAGQWRIPLRDMPSQELEIQDFIRQQGKINLSRETDVPGELRALISPAEVGRELSLQNDRTGLSLQEMAERAEQQGFLASADKESLLHVLDRSITQGHNMYSRYATGHVALVDSPHVEAAYQHTLEAIQLLEGRITEQTRGVRPHAAVMAEVQHMLDSGGWTIDDVREILPGTALDDTTLGQVMLSVSKVAEQLQVAAQRVIETGGHPGSPEVMDYLTTKAMLAEVIPMQRGVVAEAGRGLSFLNDPVSPHTRYLNDLTVVTQKQGAQSVLAMARQDVAIATPAERLAKDPAGPQRMAEWAKVNTSLGDFYEGYLGELQEQRLLASPEEQTGAALEAKLKASLEDWWARNMHTPYQGELQQQILLLSSEETQALWRKTHRIADLEQWFQDHGVPFMPRLDPGAGAGQGLLFNPADFPEQQTAATLALAQANLAVARPGFAEMFTEQYTAAKLGPRSWIKNAVGNTAMGIYAFPVRLLAEGISPIRQGVESALGRTPTPGVEFGETAALFWGLTHGTRTHWVNAAENWRTGESRFGQQGQGKTDVYPKAVTAENVAALTGIDPNGATAKVIDFLAEYFGWLSGGRTVHRILNTTDEFYKSYNFSMESAALAHAEAKRLGLDGMAMADQIATIMADPTLAARVQGGALDAAIKQTLQQALPEEGLGSLFTKVAGKSFRIPFTAQQFPVGRLLLPFVKIPVNGARFTVENSILAPIQAEFRANLAAGGRKADLALAQVVMGSLTMAAMAGLVGSGVCVGRAPSDPVQKDIFLKEHPEYSCRLPGGLHVPYDFWEPIANGMKMVADVAQLMGELKGEAAEKLAASLFFGLYKNLWAQTSARSISEFFKALQPGPGDETATQILSNVQRYARTQIPSMVSSAGTTAAVRMLDPETKAIMSIIDGMYAQFPWGSRQVPRSRSLNGEPELYGAGVGPDMVRPLVRAFFPGKWQDSDLGPADKAIRDNDMHLRKAAAHLDHEAIPIPGDMVTAEEQAASKEIKPMVLTPQEHERYQVLGALNEQQVRILAQAGPGDPPVIPVEAVKLATRRVAMSQAGVEAPKEAMTLGEMLDWLTTTDKFLAASDGPKRGKEDIFRNAIAVYHEIGKAVFLQLHPALAENHVQQAIAHKTGKFPTAEQGARRLTVESTLRGRQNAERQFLGFTEDRPTVGGNAP